MNERLRGIQPELPGFEWGEFGETFDNLPYSDLRRWTQEGDIYERIFQNVPLGRHHHVKALSFLSYVGPDPKDQFFLPYVHTRFDHQFTTAIVMEEILKQNGFPQEDIDLAILAGLIHDIATPAHGDATKKIDPEALDEEKFWWEALGKKGQDFITGEFGARRKKLDVIIQNRGLLGQVLDMADRITYTMKDLNAITMEKPLVLPADSNPYLQLLHTIISQNPKIGNIYKEIGVDRKKKEIFFNDPRNLGTFLLLRAHLHKALYLNPTNQARDFFIAFLIKALYSRDGSKSLTPQNLREMTDEGLIIILQEYYKPEYKDFSQRFYFELTGWYPEFERFENEQEAKEFSAQLRRKNIKVIGISQCKGFDPATSYKVAGEKGHILPFREYDPGTASEIEKIAEQTKGFLVFFTDASNNDFINSLLEKATSE